VSRWVAVVAALAAVLLAPAAAASCDTPGPTLRAGVGRADITPPTGYAFGGWTRADRVGRGVHTRLTATALVLQRGDRRVALVSVDLFAATGGLVKEAAERNADLGFTERNVLVSASHTHAGPSGYANFPTFNTLAPSLETTGRPNTFVELIQPRPADRQLYSFLVARLALAIRRAAVTTHPASVGWGTSSLPDVTRNRSLEAHLANHGIIAEPGTRRPEDDPDGVQHTIAPEVDVLRVDRLVRRRVRSSRRRGARRRLRTVAVPIGAWSMFANHGTTVPSEYPYFNQDHHGAAVRVFEREVRRLGRTPTRRAVLNVYGNGNEGDQSAALERQSIEHAEAVGRREAGAMIEAWREAGRRMSRRPDLDLRWTRTCFCGQETEGGRVASEPLPGMPFLTGSEEGRGPLYDVTRVPFEGRRSPFPDDSHGHKIGIPATSRESVPVAVPLMTVRVGDRVIASLPGEPTVEVGRRTRRAVLDAMAGAGVSRVIVAGLANEFILYLTTPEEYDRQHYEGGSTLFGPLAANLLRQELAGLAGRMARGEPNPEPYAFDPRNGVAADAAPFGDGAPSGAPDTQPGPVRRGADAEFAWRGGPGGHDRPLDVPFVTIERRKRGGGGWERVTDDLWLDVRWLVDDQGRHVASWSVPAGAQPGTHRFVITARRYRVASASFPVSR